MIFAIGDQVRRPISTVPIGTQIWLKAVFLLGDFASHTTEYNYFGNCEKFAPYRPSILC